MCIRTLQECTGYTWYDVHSNRHEHHQSQPHHLSVFSSKRCPRVSLKQLKRENPGITKEATASRLNTLMELCPESQVEVLRAPKPADQVVWKPCKECERELKEEREMKEKELAEEDDSDDAEGRIIDCYL